MRKGSGKAASFNLNEASDIYDPYNAKNSLHLKLNIISACKASRYNKLEGPQNNPCMDLQSRYLERKSRVQALCFCRRHIFRNFDVALYIWNTDR
jgi:hypothetical protein